MPAVQYFEVVETHIYHVQAASPKDALEVLQFKKDGVKPPVDLGNIVEGPRLTEVNVRKID